MITLKQNLIFCVAGLTLVLAGCQAAKQQVAVSPADEAALEHSRDYHPHPFLEFSVTKPVFGERPEKRYGMPPAIPTLPEQLSKVEPLTLTIETRSNPGGSSQVALRSVTRSATRIHVADRVGERQWLFSQNPVDPQRVFGQLIDHHEQAILEYHESDLADARIGNGWADIATTGIPLSVVAEMTATGQVEKKFGIVFHQYVPAADTEEHSGRAPQELWWSDSHYLPLRVISQDGTLQQEIIALSREVDTLLLQQPAQRYTAYAVVDKADWKSCDTNHFGLAQPKPHAENHHPTELH